MLGGVAQTPLFIVFGGFGGGGGGHFLDQVVKTIFVDKSTETFH